MAHASKKAVVYAIFGNGFVTALKFGAATVTHSAAMMNEAVHSLMDTLNQVFLLIGLIRGGRPADKQFAFGHGQKKYMWNLWSAIGLFSIGCGVGLSHAWHAYHKLGTVERPASVSIAGFEVDPIWVSAIVLIIALLVEGYVLLVAAREFLDRMRREGESSAWNYLISADDPTLIAILLEDTIAVTGVIMAATGIALTQITGNAIWDIAFSVVIALMLGVTSIFLGMINMRYLLDVRDLDAEQAFVSIVDAHHEVERYHDLRSVIMDENHTVVVAEIELREEALIGDMHDRIDAHKRDLIENVPDHRRNDALEEYIEVRAAVQATLERIEEVVDEFEAELKQRCPQVYHLTLEVEGLGPPFSQQADQETVT